MRGRIRRSCASASVQAIIALAGETQSDFVTWRARRRAMVYIWLDSIELFTRTLPVLVVTCESEDVTGSVQGDLCFFTFSRKRDKRTISEAVEGLQMAL